MHSPLLRLIRIHLSFFAVTSEPWIVVENLGEEGVVQALVSGTDDITVDDGNELCSTMTGLESQRNTTYINCYSSTAMRN